MLICVKDHHIPQNIHSLMVLCILRYFEDQMKNTKYVLNNWLPCLVSPSGLAVRVSLLNFQSVQEAHHEKKIGKCS